MRELARIVGVSAGSLHRELRVLADLGLLIRQEIGHQVHYRANQASPVFPEVAGLLRKTSGLADVLREALKPLAGNVTVAFIYGSLAAGSDGPSSDVDVMVLGRASFADVVRSLSPAQAVLQREVNPVVMREREFTQRFARGDGFARDVAKGQQLWLIGGKHDFAELVASRTAQRGRPRRTTKVARG